jgi:hypothetical protein
MAIRLCAGGEFPCLQNTQAGSGVERPPVEVFNILLTVHRVTGVLISR